MDEGGAFPRPATQNWARDTEVTPVGAGRGTGGRATFVTIATPDRAVQSRIFARSARACHPDARLVVLALETDGPPAMFEAHKLHLASDRTSCTKATANQFRLLIHTAAYCWCGRSPTASTCQNEVVADLRQRRPSVEQISRIGMDTSKHIFQIHRVNTAGEPVLRKKLRRTEMVVFFKKLPPTLIAIEVCVGSHHWARLLQSFGHEVKLIAPQFSNPTSNAARTMRPTPKRFAKR